MADQWSELNEQALDLMQNGRMSEAVTCLQKALDAARSDHGDIHDSVAVTDVE